MEQNDAPHKNVFYARLGVVVKRGQAYCVFCPKRINKAFNTTQGGGSHASLSNTHKKHFKAPLAENVELALHGVVQGQRAEWRCVPCGVPLHPQDLQFHLATGRHTTEMQRWDVNMEDNISCKKRKSQDELSPGLLDLPKDFLPPDMDDRGPTNEELFELFNEGVVAMEEEEAADSLLPWDAEVDFGHNTAAAFQPLQPYPDFAPAPGPAQAEATYASSAPYSTWDWILMLLHLHRRVDTLEVRFNQLERAGPAGHGGGGGGGNPGSSSGGGGLDQGRQGGQYRGGGGGGGQNQDKGAGDDQGYQQGGGSVCLSFTYTLMLAPTLLAWLHDPKKTAAVLFVVAVAVWVATWRNPAPAALVLQSPAAFTNQSSATTASRESSPAAGTVEELPRPTKDPVLVECKKRPGSAWDRLDRSDSSKYRLYAQCA